MARSTATKQSQCHGCMQSMTGAVPGGSLPAPGPEGRCAAGAARRGTQALGRVVACGILPCNRHGQGNIRGDFSPGSSTGTGDARCRGEEGRCGVDATSIAHSHGAPLSPSSAPRGAIPGSAFGGALFIARELVLDSHRQNDDPGAAASLCHSRESGKGSQTRYIALGVPNPLALRLSWTPAFAGVTERYLLVRSAKGSKSGTSARCLPAMRGNPRAKQAGPEKEQAGETRPERKMLNQSNGDQ
jgi:hypothetical protein